MESRLRILHLEDDPTDSALVRETLEAGGLRCDVTRVDTQPAFSALLEQGGFDLILADYTLPSFDGLSALNLAARIRREVPFIFVSGTLDEEVAIESLKVGATDYVFKTKMSRIVPSVRRALREAEERSRRAEAEKALRATQAELAYAARIMTMGELAATLAHEVKQPIAAAVMSANACERWLRGDAPDLGEARDAAAQMVSHASRAADIVGHVGSLYRREPPQRKPIDVHDLLEEMVVLLRPEATRHSVAIRTELAERLPRVSADRVQLQQVLMNLMLNGIEAMQDTGGELVITADQTDGGELLVLVSDSGVGIPLEQADRIFEAFFTTKPNGTGMGLAVSWKIVEAHGGRLWVSPKAERGTTFQFALPADAPAASSPAALDGSADTRRPSPSSRR